jgi:hypothetical protein
MINRTFWCMVFVSVLSAVPGLAQWSDDPAVNLVIGDGTGDQVQAKIVGTSDGGAYISWFNSAGGYDVYLQRLDAGGNEMWAHNGILVHDRNYSSIQDYGLDVDASDNAVLVFRNYQNGNDHIVAQRVSPSGTFLWGAAGIQVSMSSTAYHASPDVAATTDEAYVVGWIRDYDTVLQRLDAAGAMNWGAGIVLSHPTETYWLCSLETSDSGSVIVLHTREIWMNYRHLAAQKLDPSGTFLWPLPNLTIFDSGSIQMGNFPEFVTDGAGGAVFSWYDVSGNLQCYVQRVLYDGTEAFAHNGVAVSTNASQQRVGPSAAINPSTGDIYVFWVEENMMQSQHGVYGQKLDAFGVRQWTNSGVVISPVSTMTNSFVNCAYFDDGACVYYLETVAPGEDMLLGARLDSSGAFDWTPSIVDVSTAASDKSGLVLALNTYNVSVLTWQDARTDLGDIYVQNVNTDGSLGIEDTPTPGPTETPLPTDVPATGPIGIGFLVLLMGGLLGLPRRRR